MQQMLTRFSLVKLVHNRADRAETCYHLLYVSVSFMENLEDFKKQVKNCRLLCFNIMLAAFNCLSCTRLFWNNS